LALVHRLTSYSGQIGLMNGSPAPFSPLLLVYRLLIAKRMPCMISN
jgi:hypothetical protein